MPTRRTTRVAEVLRKELSVLMQRATDLEGLLITISAIDTSPDLKQAFVYFSVLDDREREHALGLLNKHRREWQAAINKRLPLKFVPHLQFRFDKAVERGDRIMEILRELEEETPPSEK